MKFYIHKLGCPKNDVDADYIAARLVADGHEPAVDVEEAESILVNTCGFILAAKEESVHELLKLGQLKKTGTLKTLYATGCLSQRYGNDLLKGMPELDGVFGLGDLESIAQAVTESRKLSGAVITNPLELNYIDADRRVVDPAASYAYLKISDGCDRRCAYCAIPMIRGQYRSRSMASIISEAEFLVETGKKELILVSQDATMYGHNDAGDSNKDLLALLRELEKIDGLEWIRMMYLHPAGLSDNLIHYVASSSKVVSYFDLPLQHINSEILSAMRRRIDRAGIENLLGRIRNSDPKAVIRTTFIVGFPGETQRKFEELKAFVGEFRFDRLGVFSYSPEEDTAAVDLPDWIPQEIAYDRLDEIMTLQQEIAFEKNNSLIGQTIGVIIDAADDDGGYVGRTYADCPDIDQEVYVRGKVSVGSIYPVVITGSRGYDLEGTVSED